jgi:hypothetical protein
MFVVQQGGWWTPPTPKPYVPEVELELPPAELRKLGGEARKSLFPSCLTVSLYNGSDFRLKEVTVEVTVRGPKGDQIMRRQYGLVYKYGGLDPLKTGLFTDPWGFDLGYTLRRGDKWQLAIVGAKGTRL